MPASILGRGQAILQALELARMLDLEIAAFAAIDMAKAKPAAYCGSSSTATT